MAYKLLHEIFVQNFSFIMKIGPTYIYSEVLKTYHCLHLGNSKTLFKIINSIWSLLHYPGISVLNVTTPSDVNYFAWWSYSILILGFGRATVICPQWAYTCTTIFKVICWCETFAQLGRIKNMNCLVKKLFQKCDSMTL